MEKVSAAEWRAVRAAEAEYGWAIIPEPLPWPRPGGTLRDKPDDHDDGDGMTRLTLATGTLSAEQISLVLMNLPFDLTFADEQGLVRFSSGGERVFAHTPTIIGRPLVGCHQAVDREAVQRIMTAFQAGERDQAELWFADGERFIYVLFRACA